MTTQSPSAIDDILAEHAGLEAQLADPSLHDDPGAARRVGKRFAELAPIMATHRRLEAARDDLAAARELAADDPAFADEIPALETT
ncbi:PCRF domain-containing protein, partial [Streptomyces sp. SID10244]|nr:PCRF domain-containing protein [Streptomyces sp. SID10244]